MAHASSARAVFTGRNSRGVPITQWAEAPASIPGSQPLPAEHRSRPAVCWESRLQGLHLDQARPCLSVLTSHFLLKSSQQHKEAGAVLTVMLTDVSVDTGGAEIVL